MHLVGLEMVCLRETRTPLLITQTTHSIKNTTGVSICNVRLSYTLIRMLFIFSCSEIFDHTAT